LAGRSQASARDEQVSLLMAKRGSARSSHGDPQAPGAMRRLVPGPAAIPAAPIATTVALDPGDRLPARLRLTDLLALNCNADGTISWIR